MTDWVCCKMKVLQQTLLLIVEEWAHTNIVHRSLYISCFLCYSCDTRRDSMNIQFVYGKIELENFNRHIIGRIAIL